MEKVIAEQVTKALPAVLASFFAAGGFSPGSNSTSLTQGQSEEKTDPELAVKTSESSSRGDRFFVEEKPVEITSELLDFTTKAFAQPLSKDKWKGLAESYPPIQGADNVLLAPVMEAGMKEELRKRHGFSKTKETLAFDDGLAEKQTAFIHVARPLLAALTALDHPIGEDEEEEEGLDPDSIRAMLEDALVMLGNANARLNQWRQRRFSEFLTEIGKRTLREGIPTDKHLFPQKFHEKIKSEHDHSASTTKLISKPPSKPSTSGFQPFRTTSNTNKWQNQSSRSFERKRKWSSTGSSGQTTRNKFAKPNTPRASSNRGRDSS